jgi:intracellular septation protein A
MVRESMNMDNQQSFTLVGIVLIILGVIFVAPPLLAKYMPDLEKLPWIVFWVYKREGFYFATSPLLIIISIISLIVSYLLKTRQS